MRRRKNITDGTKLIEEIKARQRNTVWPDPLVNSLRATALVLKGSPDASLVQRIGASLFGVCYLVSAVVFLYYARKERSFVLVLMSWGFFLLAGRILRNVFRRHKSNPK